MSTRKPADPIYSALEIFLEIAKEADEKKAGSKLRSRAREVTALIDEIGLIPTLSFFYSKKDDDDYRLTLKTILKYLKRLDVIKTDADDVDKILNEPNTMVKTLRELLIESSTLTQLLRPFLIEFKRLCEARWGSLRGERNE